MHADHPEEISAPLQLQEVSGSMKFRTHRPLCTPIQHVINWIHVSQDSYRDHICGQTIMIISVLLPLLEIVSEVAAHLQKGANHIRDRSPSVLKRPLVL